MGARWISCSWPRAAGLRVDGAVLSGNLVEALLVPWSGSSLASDSDNGEFGDEACSRPFDALVFERLIVRRLAISESMYSVLMSLVNVTKLNGGSMGTEKHPHVLVGVHVLARMTYEAVRH